MKDYQLCSIDLKCNNVLEDSLLKLRWKWIFLLVSKAAVVEIVQGEWFNSLISWISTKTFVNCAESWCPFFLPFRNAVQFLHAFVCVQSMTYLRRAASLWIRIKCSIHFTVKSLAVGELHHEFSLHTETLLGKVIAMQCMFFSALPLSSLFPVSPFQKEWLSIF